MKFSSAIVILLVLVASVCLGQSSEPKAQQYTSRKSNSSSQQGVTEYTADSTNQSQIQIPAPDKMCNSVFNLCLPENNNQQSYESKQERDGTRNHNIPEKDPCKSAAIAAFIESQDHALYGQIPQTDPPNGPQIHSTPCSTPKDPCKSNAIDAFIESQDHAVYGQIPQTDSPNGPQIHSTPCSTPKDPCKSNAIDAFIESQDHALYGQIPQTDSPTRPQIHSTPCPTPPKPPCHHKGATNDQTIPETDPPCKEEVRVQPCKTARSSDGSVVPNTDARCNDQPLRNDMTHERPYIKEYF
jgi:hypothetical protein